MIYKEEAGHGIQFQKFVSIDVLWLFIERSDLFSNCFFWINYVLQGNHL